MDSKKTMKNQRKSKTGNPVQDDKPRHQRGTSSHKAFAGVSQLLEPQRETSSQQAGSRVSQPKEPQPETSSQKAGSRVSQPPEVQRVNSSQQTDLIFSPHLVPQPGTSCQQSGPFFSPQPGTSSQQSGPIFSPHPQPGTSSQQSYPIFSPHPTPQPLTSSQQVGTARDPEPPDNTPINTRWRVCPFNLNGTCRHGDSCWYSHNYRNAFTNTDSNLTRHSSTICPVHRLRLQPDDIPSKPAMDPSKWAKAPEFVPQAWKSLAEAYKSDTSIPNLCPYFVLRGTCPFSASVCPFPHGDTCELCQLACLDPEDEVQRRTHVEQCERELLMDMENSFAVQRSRNKGCGICHEVVWDKELPRERRFGILEKCNHVFCAGCIRTWRGANRCPDDLDLTHPPMSTHECPECRQHSDFFVPTYVWVEGEDKLKAIQDFKDALAKIPCRNFKGGSTCPLREKCFYLHPEGAPRNPDPPPPEVEEEEEEVEISTWNEGGDEVMEISTWNDDGAVL